MEKIGFKLEGTESEKSSDQDNKKEEKDGDNEKKELINEFLDNDGNEIPAELLGDESKHKSPNDEQREKSRKKQVERNKERAEKIDQLRSDLNGIKAKSDSLKKKEENKGQKLTKKEKEEAIELTDSYIKLEKEVNKLEKRQSSEEIITVRKKITSLEKNTDEYKELYKELYKEYNELRAKYVGEDTKKGLRENQRFVRDGINENSKEKGFATKFYEAYKKMGEWNLGALLGSNVMDKLESKEDDSRLMKIGKGIAKFSTKMISVRTGISMGLVAGGAAIGGGAILAGMVGRKLLATAGATIGSYDLMKQFGKEGKGKFKELNSKEIESKDTKELYEILDHLDTKAQLNNEKGYRGKTYNLIKEEIIKRSEISKLEDKEGTEPQKQSELVKEREELREIVLKELNTDEVKRKGISLGIGVFVGSGLFAKLVSNGFNSVASLFEDSGETVSTTAELTSEIESLNEEIAEQTTRVTDAVEAASASDSIIESAVEVKSGDTVWKLAEDQLKGRIDNWDSLSEAQQTHMIDMVKDKVVADPGSFGVDAARENIFNSPAADILKVGDKVDFSGAFEDVDITSEIDKLGSLGGGEGLTTLTGVQESNILSNNEALNQAAKAGVHIDSSNVDMVSEEIKRSGTDFVAKSASLGTKISPFSIDGEPVTVASNGVTKVFQNSGEVVPTDKLANIVEHPNSKEILEKIGIKGTEEVVSTGSEQTVDLASSGTEVLDNIPEVDLDVNEIISSAESGAWTEASYAALKGSPEKLTEAFKGLITSGDQGGIKSFISDFGKDNNFNFTVTNGKAEMFTKFLGGLDGKIDVDDLSDNIDNLDSNTLNDLMSKFDESVITDIKDIGKVASVGIVDGKYAYISKINKIWPFKDTFNYEFADGNSGTVKGVKAFTEHFTNTTEPATVDSAATEIVSPATEPATVDSATVDTSVVTSEPATVDSAATEIVSPATEPATVDSAATEVPDTTTENIDTNPEVEDITNAAEITENTLTTNDGTVLEFADQFSSFEQNKILDYYNTTSTEIKAFPKILDEWSDKYGDRPNFNKFREEVIANMNKLQSNLNSISDNIHKPDYKLDASSSGNMDPEVRVRILIDALSSKHKILTIDEQMEKAFESL